VHDQWRHRFHDVHGAERHATQHRGVLTAADRVGIE
jgi:hypothetical protein